MFETHEPDDALSERMDHDADFALCVDVTGDASFEVRFRRENLF